MTNFLLFLHRVLWGAPALVMIIGVGSYIGLRTRFVQLRFFPKAVRQLVDDLREGKPQEGVSPFQALCTALAATVGTGNLVGVAGAICLGGPGAVFWMWVCAFLGMGLKYAEVTLALSLRKEDAVGGPMFMICHGMGDKWKWLAYLYALFGLVASFGVGNATQIDAVISSVRSMADGTGSRLSTGQTLGIGLLLALPLGTVLLGGAKRIASAAEFLIPFVSGTYILMCLVCLWLRRDSLGTAFGQIFTSAFSPRAITGGVIGSAFQVLRVGCARGIFTNEAGMGTASMAHSCARVSHPVEQGLLGIVEVFLDTIVICTLTALVILVSGVHIPYGTDAGSVLSGNAFRTILGNWTDFFLTGALCCFAFATVLGWGLYGARCAHFLFGRELWFPFALGQIVTVVLSSLASTERLWLFAEILNGAMAIPNLIALMALTPRLLRLTHEYERSSGSKSPVEVYYADLDQCQPL